MNRTSTRIAIAAAVATLMVSSLAAGAVAQDEEEKFVIGMSQANKGEPWRQAMNDQIQMAADKYPQLEVVFADAAQNNAKQVADVENFITQGIDLLIISPNEAAPLTDVVKKVNDLGIPNILLDRRVVGDDYMMFIGADNVLLGREAGKFVAQWCADQGLEPCNVGEIRGLRGHLGQPWSAAMACARAWPRTPTSRSSPSSTPTGCVRRPSRSRSRC